MNMTSETCKHENRQVRMSIFENYNIVYCFDCKKRLLHKIKFENPFEEWETVGDY